MRNEIIHYLEHLFGLLMYEFLDDMTKNYISSSIQNMFPNCEVVIRDIPLGIEVRVYFIDELNERMVVSASLIASTVVLEESTIIDKFKFLK